MREVTVRSVSETGLAMLVVAGPHSLRSDEPVGVGGADSGFSPSELLLASLGACTAITLRMYAGRKQWPLRDATLHLSAATVDGVYVITRRLTLEGDLNDEQRARLREIADRCPIHRAITGEVRVEEASPPLS
jgi:putative redox protein